VAIIGRSGAGKTTLLNILGMLSRPDSGSHWFGGVDVGSLSSREAARIRGSRIGFIFQSFLLFDSVTALDNVAVPLHFASALEFADRRSRAAALLRRVGLGEREASRPSQLSGGEQQRVAIARSLIRSPDLILADEPTGSLDVQTAASLLDLLFSVLQDPTRALILITHDEQISMRTDRRLLLEGGTLHQI
jgi:putative ABC transport system ATP-binding protein